MIDLGASRCGFEKRLHSRFCTFCKRVSQWIFNKLITRNDLEYECKQRYHSCLRFLATIPLSTEKYHFPFFWLETGLEWVWNTVIKSVLFFLCPYVWFFPGVNMSSSLHLVFVSANFPRNPTTTYKVLIYSYQYIPMYQLTSNSENYIKFTSLYLNMTMLMHWDYNKDNGKSSIWYKKKHKTKGNTIWVPICSVLETMKTLTQYKELKVTVKNHSINHRRIL